MILKTVSIRNFRRLKNVSIDLEENTSIFVGANNSGKTSATHIFYNFLDKKKFELHDFSMNCWKKFDDIGLKKDHKVIFPAISLDLWFKIQGEDVHKILPLLPSLDWSDVPVGVRLEYAPKDPALLLKNFIEAQLHSSKGQQKDYLPWPKSLTDYLAKRLSSEYEIRYYVLDYSKFDANLNPIADYYPSELGDGKESSGGKIIRSLIKVDYLSAQRHLSDSHSPGRAEDLSKRLSKFYQRNLQQREDDFEALRTLAMSESALTTHLTEVFKPTINSLNELGYPGLLHPRMMIKADLNQEAAITQHAKLHYALDHNSAEVDLPDSYNGLGYKNLIFMVIELLDFHAAWAVDENRPPLHFILIEEPEAHLHTQLQQVFIKKIQQILEKEEKYPKSFKTQLIVTTHSPHIIYEKGFKPIRYFNRNIGSSEPHTSNVLDLSKFGLDADGFLERYMKLTHCDLFFADAVILVEGNVERLLMSQMIEKAAPELQSCYLTILEVGGAYAFRFKGLIEFLNITTLVVTDLDCVSSKTPVIDPEEEGTEDGEEEIQPETSVKRNGEACLFDEPDAETSNQTLAEWLPKMKRIDALLQASKKQKTILRSGNESELVYVAFQTKESINWKSEKCVLAGRTLEEAFALENLEFTQALLNKKKLGLRVITNTKTYSLKEIHERLFRRIKSDKFRKTDFALGVLSTPSEEWIVPNYIVNGLKWLRDQLLPTISESLTVFDEELMAEVAAIVSTDQELLPSIENTELH